ncbi:GNAT family acetyltransferase [Lactobacillus taiwanensis]|nr:GNAT family acetyltransferase [Lactobacillus taiwanensis]
MSGKMSVKIKKIKNNQYIVRCDEQDIGTITTYHNEFHNKYLYLKFNLTKYPTYFPFNEIKQAEGQSLQVMTDSTNADLVNLLLRNDFKCKRHCYTPKVTKNDLKIKLNSNYSLYPFDINNKNYGKLCHLLYKYYQATHQPVSPLTVSEDTFVKEIPTKTGYYSRNEEGTIENFVFTEKNEIAYICSFNEKFCDPFIQASLSKLFNKYSSIFFEADDTDWVASRLLNCFNVDKEISYNTYIYE